MAQDDAPPREVTAILDRITRGDRAAAADLLPLVYGELRRLAHLRLEKLPPGQTLQSTALVHEAYLALVGQDDPGWSSRGHFFGAAAQAMRDLLVDQARRRARKKHGGEFARVVAEGPDELEALLPGVEAPDLDLIALDAALEEFRQEHPERAEIVLLHYFAGLTHAEIAAIREVSVRTIERDWRFARAWLFARMSGQSPS